MNAGSGSGRRLDARVRPRLAIVAGAVVLAGAWAADLTGVMATVIPAITAVAAAGFARREGNLTWAAIALFSAVTAANTLAWQVDPAAAHAFTVAFTRITLAGAAISAGVVFWLAARPFLSSTRSRRRTLAGGNATVVAIVGILALDAGRGTAGIPSAAGVALVVVGGLAFVWTAASTFRVFTELGRTAEQAYLLVIPVHIALHSSGLFLADDRLVHAAHHLTAFAGLYALASAGADRVGRTLEPGDILLRCRVWPIGLALSLAMISHGGLLRDGFGALTVAVVIATTIMLVFAGREFAGAGKPLLVPFSARERALHRVPSALLNGDVRLVGRAVHRTSDGAIVGIETEPDWAHGQRLSYPLARSAAEAGLAPLLDQVTVRLAQTHLPAVLLSIDADEPWLSVPVSESVFAAPMLGEGAEVEGLALRVQPATVTNESLEELRERGAMIQATTEDADRLMADLVSVSAEPVRPTAALTVGRSSSAEWRSGPAGPHFLVDDNKAPTNLAEILGRISSE